MKSGRRRGVGEGEVSWRACSKRERRENTDSFISKDGLRPGLSGRASGAGASGCPAAARLNSDRLAATLPPLLMVRVAGVVGVAGLLSGTGLRPAGC